MRILQLAPLWETVPPPRYGGTEAVVSLLTEELVRRGHEVTLAASGDSVTSARLFSVLGRSLREADDLGDRRPYEWMHTALSLVQAGRFDIVHAHTGELAMAMSHLIDPPMLSTIHYTLSQENLFIWERFRGGYNTISKSAKAHMPAFGGSARYMGHVYNAIDVDSFPFQAEKGADLLFLSRISPDKGPVMAIDAAKRLGMRLILAGKIDAYDRRYYEEVVRDLIDGDQIVFFGEADAVQKRELYRTAKCLLMPIQWEEPFGLVMPEAMACGTPVIATRRGSVPELVRHGETGFIVDTVEEMVEAVRSVGAIDPYRCRQHVRRNFSPALMAEGYERIYAAMLEQPVARPPMRLTVGARPAPAGPAADEALVGA